MSGTMSQVWKKSNVWFEGRQAMVSTKLVTADELAAMGSDAPFELIEGELHEVSPSWIKASIISSRLSSWISPLVLREHLGFTTGEQGGYALRRNPDTVVAPDLAFVRWERVPEGYDFESYFPGPPDLAVEVVSPSERMTEVQRKVAHYADAGTPLVWVIVPARRTVTIYKPGESPRTLGEQDVLDGGDVLPGLRIPVAEIFRLPTSG